MPADTRSIEDKQKSVRAVLSDAAARYRRESGSGSDFVFIEAVGFAEVMPQRGRRVKRGLQGEILEAGELLAELADTLRGMLDSAGAGAAYNSIRLRQLLRSAQVAYYNVSHRMMQDLLSVSPRKFTAVASLYNDVTNLQKLINAVRYGETDRSATDASVAKLARRITGRAGRVAEVLADYADHAVGTAGEELFGEHNIMAYRYRNAIFVNVELLLAYLGVDPEAPRAEVSRSVREREDAIVELLGTVERSERGGSTELLSRK